MYQKPQVIDAADEVLRDLVATPANIVLPREALIQHCLLPMLESLRDVAYLSLPLLKGLLRLLSLLGGCFQVHPNLVEHTNKIGSKLIEHLQQWLNPPKVIQSRCWPGKELDIAARQKLVPLFDR